MTQATTILLAGNRMVARLSIAALILALSRVVNAQPPANAFTPTRCVSDTTTALSLSSDVATVDTVAPGLWYRCLYDRRGPWAIHVVGVDLKANRYVAEGVRAMGARLGREKVSDMTRRVNPPPLVAINADFFNLETGEVENNTVIAGEWVKGVLRSDSPLDAFDNARTQFAIDARGSPLIGRFELDAVVRIGGTTQESLRVAGINYRPSGDSALVLYTPWQGERTPRDSATGQVSEIVLDYAGLAVGGKAYRVRRQSITSGGGLTIPRNGLVLSGMGSAAASVQALARSGDYVAVHTLLGKHPVPPHTVVGGWPRLIVDSVNVAAQSDSLEGTVARFSSARHPRSALAITRDSSTLMFVVVDGRRPWSAGMSLTELADKLLALGAYQAMNLDGGGSSTLWIRGTIVNYPSDATGERTVGNALMIIPRE